MKRLISILIIAVICCSTVFIPAFAESSPAVKEEYLNEDKWLSLSKNTTGARYFVDMNGNPVNLFGMARCQSHAGSEDLLYSTFSSTDALVEHYADYGCNFMRLAIDITSLCGGDKRTPAEINEYITRKIDPDVQAIIRNGLYVMLDIHMYPPGDECKTAEGVVQYARDYYLPVLTELAKKYKDEPMVAVIEIWNEPYPADSSQLTYDKEVWNNELRDYFMDAVAEIRKYDTRHVLLVSDWNAGWGMALPDTWNGYYDKVDPIYQNTCFSVHASITELDTVFDTYQNWWKGMANDNNICLLFGEVETEGGISSEQGIQNFCDMLSNNEDDYHFSGVLWRPHGPNAEYHNIWADTGWADDYCNTDPVPASRYISEAESIDDSKSNYIVTVNDTLFFGYNEDSSGISMRPGLTATEYYETSMEILKNYVYKEGNYKLLVRAAGTDGYTGDFILGYRDVSGTVHQIARFPGKDSNGQPYYQSVEFTADKKIVSFVFFSAESKEKSVMIDRVYLAGAESDEETTMRSRVDIQPINQVIDLSGKKHTIEVEEVSNDDYYSGGSSGSQGDSAGGESQTQEVIQQVVTEAPEKTTLLKNRIINEDITNLTVMMIVALSVLAVAGVFILVNFIVAKKRNKTKG